MNELQCALGCFISGYKHKLIYCMRAIANRENLLTRLDKVLTKQSIPQFLSSGVIKRYDVKKSLLSLPPKMRGCEVSILSETADLNSQD